MGSLWITPACAGNSHGGTGVSVAYEDHPRVCGEQHPERCRCKISKGSPPRVRGTAYHKISANASSGITPACAGNRRPPCAPHPHSGDHPRVCGEQGGGNGGHGAGKGSPPRVRGTAPGRRTTGPPPGITPACAGNSPRFRRCRWWPKDHPRVCGEQLFLKGYRVNRVGSPPRVRGTGHLARSPHFRSRITPACAGNR